MPKRNDDWGDDWGDEPKKKLGTSKKKAGSKPFKIFLGVTGAIVLIVIIIGVIIGGSTSTPSSTVNPVSTQSHLFRVAYEVTDTAGFPTITFINDNGGTSQASEAATPWVYTFNASTGTQVYLSARADAMGGTINVTIYTDGVVWKTSNSNGPYATATASGSLPYVLVVD